MFKTLCQLSSLIGINISPGDQGSGSSAVGADCVVSSGPQRAAGSMHRRPGIEAASCGVGAALFATDAQLHTTKAPGQSLPARGAEFGVA